MHAAGKASLASRPTSTIYPRSTLERELQKTLSGSLLIFRARIREAYIFEAISCQTQASPAAPLFYKVTMAE